MKNDYPFLLKSLLIITSLLCVKDLSAQTDFKPGYVINNNLTDTLFGEIDYRGAVRMSSVCKFRMPDQTVKEYTPQDIFGYRFPGGKYFVSKDINGKKIFVEFLSEGSVNLYFVKDYGGDHYYIEKKGYPVTEIEYKEQIRGSNRGQVFFKSTKHIGILKIFMQDAPEIFPRIDNLKTPKTDNLIKLAEAYHKLVSKDSKYEIYENNLAAFKVNLEASMGMGVYIEGSDNGFNLIQGGVIAHFWLPGVNEKLFFRTGLLYWDGDFEGKNISVLKIPFQFEYVYPKYIVRPKAALGINLYKLNYPTVAFMGGVNVKLSERIIGSINYDIDFDHNKQVAIIPDKIFSHVLSLGLMITF